MSGAVVTIAWTQTEAVLFGPESRLIRQPLADDDDRPALILELWRTEFPEIASAQLLAGSAPSAAAEIAHLAALAAQAGLRLELAPPPGEQRGKRGVWAAARGRMLRPRAVATCAAVAAALLVGGWQWAQARERERLGRLTAAERASELRQAESAEKGRRRRATDEQARALLAACVVPRQFAAEWLSEVALRTPAAIVLSEIQIDGARCRLAGRVVAGSLGAETAVDYLRQRLFDKSGGWTVENAAAAAAPLTGAGPSFHLEAINGAARVLVSADVRLDEAAVSRQRLPDKIAVDSLLAELAPHWRIAARGAESSLGVERRRYALTAVARDARAWADTLQLARRLNGFAGVAIESMALVASPGENGGLEQAAVEVSLRLRL